MGWNKCLVDYTNEVDEGMHSYICFFIHPATNCQQNPRAPVHRRSRNKTSMVMSQEHAPWHKGIHFHTYLLSYLQNVLYSVQTFSERNSCRVGSNACMGSGTQIEAYNYFES